MEVLSVLKMKCWYGSQMQVELTQVQTVDRFDCSDTNLSVYLLDLDFLDDHDSGTSSAHGILDCAPAFCTVIDAALLACAMAASRSKSAPRAIAFQRATATVYAPANVSPAAVVSTTLTLRAGTM